jgi:hypothetical protein
MNNKTIILLIGSVLIAVGVFKPDLSAVYNFITPSITTTVLETKVPTDLVIKEKAVEVTKALKTGSKDRKYDGVELAKLYRDLALLIKMDNENQIVRTTDEIREANSVGGMLLNLNLVDKYPDLAESCENVVVTAIGLDNIPVSAEIRSKTVEAFEALSWATYEGSK